MDLILQALFVAVAAFLGASLYLFWVSPLLALRRIRRNGLGGPTPSFPFGNLKELSTKNPGSASPPPISADGSSLSINHDIHPIALPYFARWRKAHGKVFIYWLGAEPFLYVADPDFLQRATSGSLAKAWGKPEVFKYDRSSLFGKGLVLIEGDEWAHHRNTATPAFSSTMLNSMVDTMVETTAKVIGEWDGILASGTHEIYVDRSISWNAAEIIARTSFGLNAESCKIVYEKIMTVQNMLFKSARLVGVPFSKLFDLKHTRKTEALGREVDELLLAVVQSRKKQQASGSDSQHDFLGFLLASNKLTAKDVVDECKTFFLAGHETTSLAITWTLFLLAIYPEWQRELREEVMEVFPKGEKVVAEKLPMLTKTEMVFKESLRLYPSGPNFQRQSREDVRVGDVVIPKGTNMWIDIVGMNHDSSLWGDDVHEFKPERFKESTNGGCKHRNGFVPFGIGGRMCIGKNLTKLEYKVVLAEILRRYSMSLSPNYIHSPMLLLTMRPAHGVPLIVHSLDEGN